MRDGVHQVRLAKAYTAVQEQRVEGHRSAFGHTARGGMGQLVRLADNEAVKGKSRVKRRTRKVIVGRFGTDGPGDRLDRRGRGGLSRAAFFHPPLQPERP